MGGLLSVLGVIGRLGILLIVFILLIVIVLTCLILNKTFPRFRNSNANQFKPSDSSEEQSSSVERKSPSECKFSCVSNSPKFTVKSFKINFCLAWGVEIPLLFVHTASNELLEVKEITKTDWCHRELVHIDSKSLPNGSLPRLSAVMTNGEAHEVYLGESYEQDGKIFNLMLCDANGNWLLNVEEVKFRISELTPEMVYILNGKTLKADADGCIEAGFAFYPSVFDKVKNGEELPLTFYRSFIANCVKDGTLVPAFEIRIWAHSHGLSYGLFGERG